jgi:AraC family transcriptional regulator
LSVSHFSRRFRQTVGVAPHKWLLSFRVDLAKNLLRKQEKTLSDVALVCGFADQSHFTRVFTRMTGISPGAWRRGLGQGEVSRTAAE